MHEAEDFGFEDVPEGDVGFGAVEHAVDFGFVLSVGDGEVFVVVADFAGFAPFTIFVRDSFDYRGQSAESKAISFCCFDISFFLEAKIANGLVEDALETDVIFCFLF